MRTSILILSILLLGLCSCSKEIIITESEIGDDLLYIKNDISPYSGKCKVVYTNSEITKEILNFSKGRLDGEAYYYYQNGKLKWRGNYKDGFISGTWEFWNENGEKVYEVDYLNDSLDGEFKSWYPSGNLKEQGNYLKNKKTGEWITYNESGTVIDKLKH